MAAGRRGAVARSGRLNEAVAASLLVFLLPVPLLLSSLVIGCSKSQPSLGLGIPLGPQERLEAGRYEVAEGVIYETELECRITLPVNSEALELGGVSPGPIELEPAPSPLYALGMQAEVKFAAVRSEDHPTWLELATLEPVPGLGDYESTRDADREVAFEALRKVRGAKATEMDLVQSKIREFHLTATVAFRIPEGVRTEALDRERQAGGALVAFFIAPEIPGEGVNLTLAAPPGKSLYEVFVTEGSACPRLVLLRDDVMGAAP